MSDIFFFDEPSLLSPPVKRAAYSDRTAWLMAEMSRLAYQKFEGSMSLDDLAASLVEAREDKKKIKDILLNHLVSYGSNSSEASEELANELAKANFSLVAIYNEQETQAFLAKLDIDEGKEPMVILAFRGTEKKLADVKTDLRADLYPLPQAQFVHRGFFLAFNAVKEKIRRDLDNLAEKYPNFQLYVTGHSLGGALSIIATKYLASDSMGACYTFGSPRVGNSQFSDSIKTPIYRVVNAADAVPRVPPTFLATMIIAILKWLPLPLDTLIELLTKYRGYVHYGDMRYLTHVEPNEDESGVSYLGLRLLSNPSLPFRLAWLVRRWALTRGRAAAGDHAMAIYSEKLKAYAQRRN